MKKQTVIGIVAVFVILSVLFSLAFTVVKSEHECDGECCDVCSVLDVCISNLKFTVAALLISVISALLAIGFIQAVVLKVFSTVSPVSLKVKMSN